MRCKEESVSRWKHFCWEVHLSKVFGKAVRLVEDQIESLKNSREKTSIWKLVITDGMEFIPIVLKIFKPPLKTNHTVEINMYKKAKTVFMNLCRKFIGWSRL